MGVAVSEKDHKKELESLRAEATRRAAEIYLERKRSGSEIGVTQCCDLSASETGLPRPAESSVRRLLPKLMTPDEKREKERKDVGKDRRAAATKRAAEIYREKNGNVPDGQDVKVSVPACCQMVAEEFGVRPAESSLRRMLARMYEEDGVRPPKLKKARPSPPSGGKKEEEAAPRAFDAASHVPPAASVAAVPAPAPVSQKQKSGSKKRKSRKPAALPSDDHFAAGLAGFAPEEPGYQQPAVMPSDEHFAAGLAGFAPPADMPPLPPAPALDDIDVVGV